MYQDPYNRGGMVQQPGMMVQQPGMMMQQPGMMMQQPGQVMMVPGQMMMMAPMPAQKQVRQYTTTAKSQREARWREKFGTNVITIQQEEGNGGCFCYAPEAKYDIID
jgi:hypothetical protein